MKAKSLRNTNIELLRLLAIVLITLNHVSSLGISLNEASTPFNTLTALFFVQGGKFGSQLFLLISAWFLTESEFRGQRVFAIWFETFFYGIVLGLADQLLFGIDHSPLEILKAALPLTGSTYWYARAYILLLCLIPLLRKLQDRIRHPKLFLGILFTAFSLIPTLTCNGLFLQSIPGSTYIMTILRNETIWFAFVFLLIRDLRHRDPDNIKHPLLKGCLLYLIMFALTAAVYYYGRSDLPYASLFLKRYTVFRDLNSPICLSAALYLFLYTLRLKPRTIPFINRLSTHAFGIYLFQCNASIKPLLWKTILSFSSWYQNSPFFLPLSLGGIVLIMIMGILFDLIYQVCSKPLYRVIASIKAS